MSRIQQPLNSSAVRLADNVFYREHPEMVDDGIIRLRINPETQPRLAARWRELYLSFLPETESPHEEPVRGVESIAPCDNNPQREDYLHVFVLVPGTTRPVNNLFDFAISSDADHSAGRSYWIDSFIESVDKLKTDADRENRGDDEYHSCKHYDFNWSGDNNHNERIYAGRSLADELWNKYSSWSSQLVYFHLIGHSHGGNTINTFTDAISGNDSRVQFGDRWFIKSITYLSTPFFQKIEQPSSTRIHGSSIIFNIRNYYDLTQLCIADFIVEQATSGSLSQLSPLVEDIKTKFAEVTNELGNVKSKLDLVLSKIRPYLEEKASNLNPFGTSTHDAEEEYEDAKDQLSQSIGQLKSDIDALATSIIASLEVLESFLVRSRTSSNQSLIDEMQAIILTAKTDIIWIKDNSQLMIDHASTFEVSSLVVLLFRVFDKLLGAISSLVKDDNIFRIVILFSLNILEFFDDTLQDNNHYSDLSGFTNELREVDSIDENDPSAPNDPYDNRVAYQRLRDALEPHEEALHQNFPDSVRSFRRGKWSIFDTTVQHLTPIFKVLIAQVSTQFIRPYKEYPAILKSKVDMINRWNSSADWIPFYDAQDLDSYTTRISNSADTIDQFIDSIIEHDLQLYEGDDAMAGDIPGTIPYLAVVSHSISREKLSDTTVETLLGNVTRG